MVDRIPRSPSHPSNTGVSFVASISPGALLVGRSRIVRGRPSLRGPRNVASPLMMKVVPVLRVVVPAVLAYISGRPRVSRRLPRLLRNVNPFVLSAALAQIPGPQASVAADAVLSGAPAGVALLLLAGGSGSGQTERDGVSLSQKPGTVRPKRLRRAFAVGAAGSLVGAGIAAISLTSVLGSRTAAALAAVFCATYIGGTLNYVAVGRAVGLGEELMAAGLASDLLLMMVYFGYLFWKGKAIDGGRPRESKTYERAPKASPDDMSGNVSRKRWTSRLSKPLTAVLPLVVACAIQIACHWVLGLPFLAAIPGIASLEVLFVSVIATFVARSRIFRGRLSSAGLLAEFALLLFFSALGSVTRVAGIVQAGPAVFGFGALVLAVHAMAMVCGAKWALRVPIRECLLASNANVGGPTTAAAYAAALGWSELVGPAVLIGSLGYAIATPLGIGLHALITILGRVMSA